MPSLDLARGPGTVLACGLLSLKLRWPLLLCWPNMTLNPALKPHQRLSLILRPYLEPPSILFTLKSLREPRTEYMIQIKQQISQHERTEYTSLSNKAANIPT